MRSKTFFVYAAIAILGLAAIITTRSMMVTAAHPTASVSATPLKVSAKTRSEKFDGIKIVKSDAEWKKILTAEQFHILREKGTEQPYSGEYDKDKKAGTYHCAACDLALFSSKAKFDSGTGWPSFYQVLYKDNVQEETDRSLGDVRTEVVCKRCGGHLGHVFDDGPEPTGLPLLHQLGRPEVQAGEVTAFFTGHFKNSLTRPLRSGRKISSK